MRRFFTIMMTLSLIVAVTMPFFCVTSLAETGQTSASETSDETDGAEPQGNDETNSVQLIDFSNGNSNDQADVESDGNSNDQADDQSDDNSENTSEQKSTADQKDKSGSTASNIGDDSSYYNIGDFPEARNISAPSAILMDAGSGAVLYEKAADEKRYPASTTKVMTALLAIENCKMDDIVTFTSEAVNSIPSDSSSAGVNVGAQLSVEDCLYILMLQSANEVANALAEHIAGSVEEFPKMMTRRAKELGCTGTNFVNAHGYWEEDHYTTARDLALILQQAMQYDEFRKVTGTVNYKIEASDTLKETIYLLNHSKILRKDTEFYYENAEGSKTGYTDAAQHTLVTFAKKGNVELICVVLKEEKQMDYLDTAALFEWGFDKVKGITPLSKVSFKELISSSKDLDKTEKKSISSMKTSFNKDYYILVPTDFNSSKLNIDFEKDEDKKEKRLGYITISSGKTLIGKAPVTYKGSSVTQGTDKKVSGDEDGLETAPNSDTSLKPHKLLTYLFRGIIALLVIAIIAILVIRNINNKKSRKDFGRRNKARQSRSQGGKHTGKKPQNTKK